ncbi:unnamed protein product [Thlaspi arvense]|uniref:Uncharacterized protein n=1 Tax=Thlaspi arvense TaxID=13288 RepID=A0AAU9R828_THLAR|nr:unnamed protein product [Thlaspi arvense]
MSGEENKDSQSESKPNESTLPESKASESKPNGSKPNVTKDDAFGYLRAMKDKFHDDRKKYNDFLVIMNNFKARIIDRNRCIKEVKKLFKGHQDLISGFNVFLPNYLELHDWDNVEVKINN